MFDFDTPVWRKETDSIKWQKYHGTDILPMWVADMDFRSPPAVIEALQRRVEHGVFGYGTILPASREAVMDYLHRTYGWRVEPQWLVWLPGVVTALNVACRSVGVRNDLILTTTPVYPPFLSAPGNSGRRLATTRMVQRDDGWQMDFEDLARGMKQKPSLFILCNPHNPCGRIFRREELERLAGICLEHDAFICSDEIHCDLILDENRGHIPIATLSDEVARKTITLMAPSKTYNIPGLGCSFAIVPDDTVRRRFKRTMAGIVPHVNVMGMVAARAAYRQGHDWLSAVIDYLRDNHDMVFQAISAMEGLSMNRAEATYLAWIDVRNLGFNDPAAYFEQAGVGLSDGRDFDGPGYIRLNFGCSRKLLSQALDRMAAAVAAL